MLDLEKLVSRFLAWPLPTTVCCDPCAAYRHYEGPRSGTNLLTADEARQMLRHILGEDEVTADDGPRMTWAVGQRMQYIDIRLNVQGFVQRKHLESQFQISAQQASNDLKRFQQNYPGRMIYNKSAKRYVRDPNNVSGPIAPRRVEGARP